MLCPFMLYTSNFIYKEYNRFLRLNDLFQINSNNSQYSMNQKKLLYGFAVYFTKQLSKLKDLKSKVYRGSTYFDYNYKPNQII